MGRYTKVVVTLVAAILLLFIAEVASVARAIPYRFIKTDHPVDMLMDGTGRWVYYGFQGKAQDTLPAARQELFAQGFHEDFSNRPWYRFTKGDDQVILCSSDQIAVSGDKLVHFKGSATSGFHYANVWVHESGRRPIEFWGFQVKKRVLLW
jgi:hypothetical protein